MKQNLYLLSGALLLLNLAGCSTTPTTTTNDITNDAVAINNTNTKQTNETVTTNQTTNAVAEDENTNASDNNTNSTGDAAVDTSDWLTYTNEEYGFSFKYPDDWQIETVTEGGLGKDLGDVQLSKDKCFIHIDKPAQASDDILTAFITGELRGLSVEVLSINGVDTLKEIGVVNTYGDIGASYRILNNNREVSLIVMQSGFDVESCAKNYSIMVNSITKF